MHFHDNLPLAGMEGGRFLGLDCSLTAFGVAALTRAVKLIPPSVAAVTTELFAPKLRGAERLVWFRDRLVHAIVEFKPAGAAVEGYSFGSRNGREQAGELGGVVRMLLWEHGIPVIVVPPMTLKKFATGSGKIGKGTVQKELFKRWAVDLDDDNEADACVLAIMAGHYFAPARETPLTAFQQDAMKKVELLPARRIDPVPATVRHRVRAA